MHSNHDLETFAGLNPRTARKLFALLGQEYEGVSWTDFRRWAGRDLGCFAKDSRWIPGDLIQGYFDTFHNGKAIGKRLLALYDAKAHRPSMSAYDDDDRPSGGSGSGGGGRARKTAKSIKKRVESLQKQLRMLERQLATFAVVGALLLIGSDATAQSVNLDALKDTQRVATSVPKDGPISERDCRTAYSGVVARSEMTPTQRKVAIAECVAKVRAARVEQDKEDVAKK